MQKTADTIAAIATPPGIGGISVVRVSGPAVAAIARQVIVDLPPPRRASLRSFRAPDASLLDEGVAIYFPAPASYTGEDVLELQGHGGAVVAGEVLRSVVAAGARPARPGEFAERAFLGGRLDLAQAEAVADLINSATAGAARAAMRSLKGEFSKEIAVFNNKLEELRAYIEAAIDFPEEEIDFLSEGDVGRRLRQAGPVRRTVGAGTGRFDEAGAFARCFGAAVSAVPFYGMMMILIGITFKHNILIYILILQVMIMQI